jgi:hypothetical protein
MRKFSKKQYIAAGAAAVIVAAGAGTAFAYWTSTGTGSGSATAGTDTGITVYQTSSVANLSPGSAAQALSGDFKNTNASAVKVSQVNVAFGAATVWQTGCTSADFTLVQPTAQTDLVPVGDHVGAWSGGSIAMVNGTGNQDGCKNQAITLAYTTTTAPNA